MISSKYINKTSFPIATLLLVTVLSGCLTGEDALSTQQFNDSSQSDDASQEALAGLQEEYDVLQEAYASLLEEFNGLMENYNASLEELVDLKNWSAALPENVDNLVEDHESLLENFTDLQKVYDELSANHTALEKERDDLIKELAGPKVDFDFLPSQPRVHETVQFEVYFDEELEVDNWHLDFGNDGKFFPEDNETRNARHWYNKEGEYTIRMVVVDEADEALVVTKKIVVLDRFGFPPGEGPDLKVDFTWDPLQPSIGDSVTLLENASSRDAHPIERYEWRVTTEWFSNNSWDWGSWSSTEREPTFEACPQANATDGCQVEIKLKVTTSTGVSQSRFHWVGISSGDAPDEPEPVPDPVDP